MVKISDIDSNFAVKTKSEKADLHFYDVSDEPFKLYGRFKGNDRFMRLPKSKGTFIPPLPDAKNTFESIIDFSERKMRDITVNFPLYSDVKKLYIGLSNDASLKAPREYKKTQPIVYYGSSNRVEANP